jgi:UDP-glucose 4-epimerase
MKHKYDFLVLGGAGFIAQELIDALLSRSANSTVLAVDRDLDRLASLPSSSRLDWMQLNLDESNSWTTLSNLGQFSNVIHLAANSDIRLGASDISFDFRDTLMTSFLLAEHMKSLSPSRLLFASSSAIFGQVNETISGKYDEIPKVPISNYGWCKLISERVLERACLEQKVNLINCRFPNVIGGGVTHGILFDFKNKLRTDSSRLEVLGNGWQSKPYIHVQDLVEVLLELLVDETRSIYRLNVAPSDTITVREIVEIVREFTGLNFEASYQMSESGWPGDVPKYRFDVSSFSKEFVIRSSKQAVRDAVKEIFNSKE